MNLLIPERGGDQRVLHLENLLGIRLAVFPFPPEQLRRLSDTVQTIEDDLAGGLAQADGGQRQRPLGDRQLNVGERNLQAHPRGDRRGEGRLELVLICADDRRLEEQMEREGMTVLFIPRKEPRPRRFFLIAQRLDQGKRKGGRILIPRGDILLPRLIRHGLFAGEGLVFGRLLPRGLVDGGGLGGLLLGFGVRGGAVLIVTVLIVTARSVRRLGGILAGGLAVIFFRGGNVFGFLGRLERGRFEQIGFLTGGTVFLFGRRGGRFGGPGRKNRDVTAAGVVDIDSAIPVPLVEEGGLVKRRLFTAGDENPLVQTERHLDRRVPDGSDTVFRGQFNDSLPNRPLDIDALHRVAALPLRRLGRVDHPHHIGDRPVRKGNAPFSVVAEQPEGHLAIEPDGARRLVFHGRGGERSFGRDEGGKTRREEQKRCQVPDARHRAPIPGSGCSWR